MGIDESLDALNDAYHFVQHVYLVENNIGKSSPMPVLGAEMQKNMVKALSKAHNLINTYPVRRACNSCIQFTDGGICNIAGKAPPEKIKPIGCPQWANKFEVPF